jgi:hypothetical protein
MSTPTATAEEAPLSEKARKQRMSPVERAAANPKSLKLAIQARCFQCQDTGVGTPHITKSQVRDCAVTSCALWPHRGWQSVTTRNARDPL